MQHHILGSLYANHVMGVARPRVALLNIGEESEKGDQTARTAHELMTSGDHFNFVGNVEGKDIFTGRVADVGGAVHLYVKAGGSAYPATYETVENREHYIHQDGQAVFKAAVSNMSDVALNVMERNRIAPEDIAYLVPHQANMRIIAATAHRMGLPAEKCMINIEKFGNTTAATLPLCLWDYETRLKKGDNLILAAFGGGYTWGAAYVKWAYDGGNFSK
ncbi:hypothetical protein FACS1894159_12120 [Bacteroidia bacterium]|nr:hypothetical protein FACS1894159_12120 [Bacteroidia bacterium]